MNLDFSGEQLALRDTVRDVFERTFPAAALRALWGGGEPDPKVWRALADVGVCGLLTAAGGGSEVDLAPVLEEAGRAAVVEPLVDTVAVASSLLPDRAAKIAAGDLRVVIVSARMPFVANADRAELLVHIAGDAARTIDPGDASLRPVVGVDRARRLFAVEIPEGAGELLVDDADAVDLARARGAAATANVLNGVGMRLLEMSVEHAKAREQFGR
ncbi:MAG TPA: acyl-CoA dehydrogenase, partial [Actinomycetota bacterium]